VLSKGLNENNDKTVEMSAYMKQKKDQTFDGLMIGSMSIDCSSMHEKLLMKEVMILNIIRFVSPDYRLLR